MRAAALGLVVLGLTATCSPSSAVPIASPQTSIPMPTEDAQSTQTPFVMASAPVSVEVVELGGVWLVLVSGVFPSESVSAHLVPDGPVVEARAGSDGIARLQLGAASTGAGAVAVDPRRHAPVEVPLPAHMATPLKPATPAPQSSSTPQSSSMPTPESSPVPTVEPPPAPAGCAAFSPEVGVALRTVPVPDGLCLHRVPSSPVQNCPNACYVAWTRTIWLIRGSPVGGLLNAEAHEVCHAHQHQVVLAAGRGLPNGGLGIPGGDVSVWPALPEGIAFAAAFDEFKRVAPSAASSYTDPTHIEDFAELCAHWIAPQPYFQDATIGPMMLFFERWLPR